MRNKTFFIVVLAAMLLVTACADTAIDRHALVMRNNPHVTKIDSLHSLTVGNGRFAFTADATGLQTFPEYYKEGLSLGTYSEWGWHSFPNKEDYKIVETLQDHPLPGHPHGMPYNFQKVLNVMPKRQSGFVPIRTACIWEI